MSLREVLTNGIIVGLQVVTNFPGSLLAIPPPLLDGTMQCAITGLTLTERYSLVDAAKFLVGRPTLPAPSYASCSRRCLISIRSAVAPSVSAPSVDLVTSLT